MPGSRAIVRVALMLMVPPPDINLSLNPLEDTQPSQAERWSYGLAVVGPKNDDGGRPWEAVWERAAGLPLGAGGVVPVR